MSGLMRLVLVGAALALSRGALAQGEPVRGPQPSVFRDIVSRTTLGQFWGAVLVARGEDLLLCQGFGLANDDLQPITPDHLFDIGSVSKQFTAAAVLKLEMEGKLKTGDSIAAHLDGINGPPGAVTIGDLLHHTSGLASNVPFAADDLYDRDAMVRRVVKTPMAADPGDRFEYSNVGYFVLAAIIERASGERFEDYLRTRLFEPAGMASTGFVRDERLDKGMETARVYGQGGTTIRSTTLRYPWNWGQRGATGVVTTVRDLLAWDRALRADAVLNAGAKEKLYEPGAGGHACGWFVEAGPDSTTKVHHGGSTGGYSAYYSRFLEKDAVIVVLSNNAHDPREIERRLGAELFPSTRETMDAALYLARYTPDANGVVEIVGRCRWSVMPRYVGRGADGAPMVDERVTLALVDEQAGFWPAIIKMDPPVARRLLKDLVAASAGREAPKDGRGGEPAMDVVIGTQPYARDANGMISLPSGTVCAVVPQCTVQGPDGEPTTDPRTTLVLQDAANGLRPLIVKMNAAAAEGLAEELRGILGEAGR